LGDSAVVLRARIKTLPGAQWGIGRQYNELLKAACDAAGIEIPFPHMTVWMGEAKAGGVTPPVHIRSEGGRAPNPPAQPGGDTAGDGEPAPPLRTPSADAPLDGS
ncbi:MAG: mechanosensitive ion channel family protein, partial [Pseudomonadota bacterium]